MNNMLVPDENRNEMKVS